MAETNTLLRPLDLRWRRFQKEWNRTQKKYSEDSVHGLRISSRRLIAVFETLLEIEKDSRIRDTRRRVKKLLDGLSPLRDLHVQRSYVSRMVSRFPQLKSFEKSLADKETRTAKTVQRLLKRAPKLDNAMVRVKRQARKKIGQDDIRKVIDLRYRKVLALAARVDGADTETIHRLRLAFKKFRYTCEVAHPLIKEEVNVQRLKELHAFQTMMGDIQDIEVLSTRLAKWTEKHKRDDEMQSVFEELQADRGRKIDTFTASIGQVQTFWRPETTK